MRVLHVAQPTDAGVARCVADFSADQARRGWDVAVACPPAGPLRGWLAVEHLRWEASRSPGPAVPVETARLRRLVAAYDPDLVHLHSSKAGLAGRLALRGGRPTVFQPHAWSYDAVTGPARRAALAWERRAAAWAHRIVCVSEAERASGEASGIRGTYVVIPNGVDLDALPPATEADRAAARAALGLEDGPLAVCVGRLSRQKGQDVLLDAWQTVARQVKRARLELVGDGPELSRLAARGVRGVTFRGRRADIPDWLAAADVVVVPSRWEGMSLTVLEAMARGRSVVATDVGGVRESLGEPVVPPGDATALAEAIVARLTDPAVRAAEESANRARAGAAFGLDRTTAAMARLYQGLCRSTG